MAEVCSNKAETGASSLELKVSDDKLSVALSCDVITKRHPEFPADLDKRLKALGVTAAYDKSALEASLVNDSAITDLVIVRGKPPIPAEDARLEWTDDYFKPGYYIDPETDRIDFHRRVEKIDVEKDQLLVRVIPAREGQDGSDVFGHLTKAPRAKNVELRAGTNVYWDEAEKGYRARVSGRVRMVGRIIDVDQVYHIRGDIGKDTGNIKHNGPLIVDGNIESDFEVEAAGDIEVRGLVYASNITCGGNLIAREGINENLNKKIMVKGDLVTKYILNAVVESSGKVLVQNEIFQSQVKTSGEINCENGRIVGGEVMAAAGVTTGEAGSKANIKTSIIAGIDYALLEQCKTINDDIIKLKDVTRKLTPVYNKLKAARSVLTPAQKEGMTEISFQLSEAEEGIKELEEKYKEVRKEIYSHRDAAIKIVGIVHPGAILRICDSQHTVEHPLLGPLVAALDRITCEVALSSGTET